MAVSLSDASFLSKSQINLIYNVLEDLKPNDKEVTIEPLGEVGDNFVADVRVIKIKEEGEKDDFRIIAKITPSSRQSTMSTFTSAFFKNEITMYTEVLSAMSELQEKAGVELKNAFQFATCYGFSAENQQEILLLEDLSRHGYCILDKFKPLSNETIKLVLTSLADYHSMSYALKYKSPESFEKFANRLIDMNDLMAQQEMNRYNMLGENFSRMFDDEKYKNLIKSIFTAQNMEKTKKLKEMDAGSKYSVIVHGDTWTNNILFRVNGDEITDCIFIDYQLVRESMPVIDILYLIFNCTDYQTRARHYNEWLDHYHSQLEKSLFNFDLRINNVYPRDKLDSDLIRYAKQVLMMAVMTLSILLRKREESANFKEAMNDKKDLEDVMDSMQISSLHTESVVMIKERVEGLIDSCFEFGLVNAI